MSSDKTARLEKERRLRLWKVEKDLLRQGMRYIAGVDEAGRGPLAGPVVVAAVMLRRGAWFTGLNDSKQVRPEVRERLYDEICAEAIAYAVEVVPVEVIDDINILQATHFGMRAVLQALQPQPDIALIDGLPLPACPLPQRNLVKGDALSASIAAASILAKVTRDRLLRELDVQYPGYGFANHKGYSTPEHFQALERLGPCPAHRRSFSPMRLTDQTEFELEFADDGES